MPRKYGAGSVFPQKRDGQPTGKWIGQWSEGRDVEGRIRRSVIAETEAAAWKLMASERGKSSSTRRRRGGETVGEFLERWLADVVKTTRKERTYWGYVSIVEHHLEPAFGKKPLRGLTRRDVQTWVAKHPRSPLTVRHHVDCLRAAMSYAVKWGFIETNPAKGLDLPTVKRKAIRAVDQEDAEALLADFAGHELAPMVTVAIYTGLRQGELLALRWEDVNLGRSRTAEGERAGATAAAGAGGPARDGAGDAGSLTVHNALARLPGPRGTRYVLDAPKSAKSRRTVPLIPEAQEALRAIRGAQLVSDIPNPSGLVFGRVKPDKRTGVPTLVPHDGTQVTRAFQAHLREVGRPHMRWHDLRHATASLLIAAGVPLSAVADLLGHSGISITNDTYGHLTEGVKRDAMAKIGSKVTRLRVEEMAR